MAGQLWRAELTAVPKLNSLLSESFAFLSISFACIHQIAKRIARCVLLSSRRAGRGNVTNVMAHRI